MKKLLLISILVFFLTGSSDALNRTSKLDSTEHSTHRYPLELSFFKHAISWPFEKMFSGSLHPGFTVGTERLYTKGRFGNLFQNLNAGYFYNKYNAKAFFLQTSTGYRYTLEFGLLGDLSLGLGYLHSFHPVEIYSLNNQGIYERAKDKGKSAVFLSFSVGVGYDFSRKMNWPLSVFLRYQPFLQTPYSQETSFMLHSMLHLGIRVQIW